MSRFGRFALRFLLVLLSVTVAILLAADSTITIANFNIQVFGQKKASKPEVMYTLAKIISRFDIVAIQEIRDPTYNVIEAMLFDLCPKSRYVVKRLHENYICALPVSSARTTISSNAALTK
jgi:hypothetical protein